MGCGPSKFKGEGQRLGSAASSPTTVTRPPTNRAPMAVAAPAVPAPARTRPAQATLGSGSPPTGDAAKRAAAAAAAERRLQGVSADGLWSGVSSAHGNS